ncbi:MAG TPA: tyrosine-type recombinase/integrase [Candidatus Acidoferrales bacterium]|nr:tyrosine-type recombinase/integrase [Candidatus Acidoferrales bacterium]HYW46400.1 tyrosine-type recombinase/integrase [Bryobacteraceae bacterium]
MRAFKVRRNDEVYFRVDLPKHLFPDGKRRSAMGKTKHEAIERAEKLVEQRRKGLHTDEAKSSLADFLKRFLEFYKTEGGVALRTWQDYRYHAEENVIPAIGAITLAELKPRDVDLWLKSLRDRGLGARTVEYAQAVLRRALQFAVEWEIIDRNPAAARFRAAKRKRAVNPGGPKVRFLNPDQAREFLEVAQGDRQEALYALDITTGLRPEELYGLRSKDMDLDVKRLTVNQVLSRTRRKKGEEAPRFVFGPPKTDKSRRTIDFPEFVRDLLIEQRRQVVENRALAGENWKENGLVFPSEIGTPLDERNVLRRFQKICEENGLPKLRLYDLRHTHASLLIHEGVHPKKISERLGHSSIKLTMDTYGHLFEGSDRDSAEKMERLFRGEPKTPRVLSMPDRNQVADKTADKNTEARLRRASK